MSGESDRLWGTICMEDLFNSNGKVGVNAFRLLSS